MDRRLVIALLAAIAALAAGVGVGVPWWGLGGPSALRLEELAGDVVVSQGGAEQPGAVGLTLSTGDRVATGDDGYAVLAREGGASLRLGSATTVEVAADGADALELELERGQVRARVRDGGEAVVIGSRGRKLRASGGELAVAVSDDGRLAADASAGAVLVGVPGVEVLPAGERVVVDAAGVVGVFPVPAQLLLEVAWPGPVREPSVTLQGTTEPGATVVLVRPPGPRVTADASGAFEVPVPLQEGDQEVELLVTGLLSGARRAVATVRRDSTAPTVKVELQYR